jgi:hypothetical protein
MSDQSARRFINVADRFGGKTNTVALVPPAVLYALAAPSTDDAVVEEVIETRRGWREGHDRRRDVKKARRGVMRRAILQIGAELRTHVRYKHHC